MTPIQDLTDDGIEQLLRRHANDAPPNDGLLDRVRVRTRRRRNRRTAGAAVLAVSGIAAGLVGLEQVTESRPPVYSAADPLPAAPGWRWESFGAVQLQVPDHWGYAVKGWSLCDKGSSRRGLVGKPNRSSRPCGVTRAPLPPPSQRNHVVWVGMLESGGTRQVYDHGWVAQTRDLNVGTPISVFSDDPELRRRILDSVTVTNGVDAFGCPKTHPFGAKPVSRPADAGGLGDVGRIESVSVCSYRIEPEFVGYGTYLSGRLANGDEAERIAQAVRAAPQGVGPNAPETCSRNPHAGPESKYGSEIAILAVRGSDHDQEVVVRYGGCEHNGTDDGRTARQLTRDVARSILTGPNAPWLGGKVVDDLLR